MRYDFTKVRRAIGESGKTLRELEQIVGVNYSTISKAVRSNRAHPSTALALTKAFRISMKAIQVKPRRVA